MSAFWSLVRFELRYQMRGPTFAASFIVFFLLAFFATVSDRVTIGGIRSVDINAPSAVALSISVLSLFALFIPTSMLAGGVIRDVEYKTEELFHATPLRPSTFILGRFTGGFLASVLAFASVPLAIYVGCFMPWLDPERLGPMGAGGYLYLYGWIGGVNMLVSGLVFFTVSNLTRSMFATYTALTIFLFFYLTGTILLDEPQYRDMIATWDPIGVNTLVETMRYWTPAERNLEIVPLQGTFLVNRLLWVGIGVLLLLINVFTFSFTRRSSGFRRPRGRSTDQTPDAATTRPSQSGLPRVQPESHPSWRQLGERVRFEATAVLKNVAFWILLAVGVLNTLGSLLNLDVLYGTPSYPMTRVMLESIRGAFGIIPLIIAVYYASELVWRERAVGVSEVVDATPTPSWVFVLSKFLALSMVVASLFLVAIMTAVVVQLVNGYSNLELDQYALRFAMEFFLPFTLLSILSLFVQVLTNNRWLGVLMVVLYIVATLTLADFGYDHNLLIFGSTPATPYSDLNGYGHFLAIRAWFLIYWGFWSAVLMVLTYLLWNRGSLRSLPARLRGLGSAPVSARLIIATSLIGATASGAWIFYNTNIRNQYMNNIRVELRSLDYEDRYRTHELLPQPKIVAVNATVDMYPHQRRTVSKGTYELVNRTDEAVDMLLVDYAYGLQVLSQSIDRGSIRSKDDRHNTVQFELEPPMEPNEMRTFHFETIRTNPGFKNSDNQSPVVDNGSFLNNLDIFPLIGFNPLKLLQAREDRRRYDREPLPRAPDLEDEVRWTQSVLRSDSDWVDFEATLSTVDDQVAIAPGYLTAEWKEGGRRYFRYEMDRPIMNFFSFQSARYEVQEEKWRDVDLQVFYHPEHDFNVDRMMSSMRASLEYFTANFSPFQYRQMRILEFPAYERFAQSFPNTVPYSESIGFILDLRDETDIDAVFYVTAHEVAHQWWAHQVCPAFTQGWTMVIETFAQYSALMVMEKAYGHHHLRRFLKYELDRYLAGRATEPEAERPLYRVEDQGYIHYRKGSLVMYALKDYLGEEVVNRSLARLIREYGGSIDPYPRSVDFLRILREEAPEEYGPLITDLFEKIILYDLRVIEADVEKRDDGRFDVSMTVSATKLESDEKGHETELELDLPIDIGVFSKDLEKVYEGTEHILVFEKHRIRSGETSFDFVVDSAPVMVGIDPYNKLIDRISEDNVRRVEAPQ
ncbi:MAG: ABC transporter permease/M1 family aminopeptidase [Myxococcota bacterium]